MLSGISTNTLSQIYKSQTNEYTKVLESIASGQKFTKPSDDFVAYTRTRTEESNMAEYSRINENLVKAKEDGTLASSTGNAVFETLTELKELQKNYIDAGGTGDDDNDSGDAVIIKAQYEATLATLNDLISVNAVSSTSLAVTGVSVSPNGGSPLTLKLDDVDISGISANIDDDIDEALKLAAGYTATADAFNSAIDRQLTINENVMAAKENSISAIRDIDDVAAISKATALEIRQTASISMISQANIMQSSIVRLFS